MEFKTGQIIFALFFIIAFVVMLIYTYRKDLKLHKKYYKKVWLVLVIVILVMLAFKYIAYYLHE
jgi:hypothetical membrane protein